MRNDRLITLKGFLSSFLKQDQERKDRPFCFILGAGASKPSGILGGADMALGWLQEMHRAEDFEELSLEQWATAERLGIQNFCLEGVSRFYPELYSRRFREHEEEGFAFLENQMDGKEPSFGYSVLAYLLSQSAHKVVITTNFDNLIADALSIHSNTFPIVVGHDSLAAYARVELRRPLIAKVHGGLGFQPKSSPQDLSSLPEAWKAALQRILNRYTPVVIGYDGNDGSLMSFLEGLPEGTPDTIFWCFRSNGKECEEHLKNVPDRIKKFVEQRKGALVPIPGFDEMMAMLLQTLKAPLQIPDLFEQLKDRARKREENYDRQQHELSESLIKASSVIEDRPKSDAEGTTKVQHDVRVEIAKTVAAVAGERSIKQWWAWVIEAAIQPDLNGKNAVFKSALEALPNDSNLLNAYAAFLSQEKKDSNLDFIDSLYNRAIEIDPKNASFYADYAIFLQNVRKNVGKAEEFFKRAMELNPNNGDILANYAIFLQKEHRDNDRIEELYKRAISKPNTSSNAFVNYAFFLQNERNEADGADSLFKRAISADPGNALALVGYAVFLNAERKEADQAEMFFKRAINAGPKNSIALAAYANFLVHTRKNPRQAEPLFELALKADPENPSTLTNYALFLENERKDAGQIHEIFKKALSADPNYAPALATYARFIYLQQNDATRVDELYARAVANAPRNADILCSYAVFLEKEGKDLEKVEEFYRRAIAAKPQHINSILNLAQILLIGGQKDEARLLLEQAEDLEPTEGAALSEMAFYRLAHFREAWPKELPTMKRILVGGARSEKWDFSGNIQRAQKDGHSNVELLQAIADVISKNAPIESLDKFPEWCEPQSS